MKAFEGYIADLMAARNVTKGVEIARARDDEWRALLGQAEKTANDAFDRLAVQSARLVSEARREGEIEALKLVLGIIDAHGLIDCRESVMRGCKGTRRHVEELIAKLEA